MPIFMHYSAFLFPINRITGANLNNHYIRRVSAYSHVEHRTFFRVDDSFIDRLLLRVVDHFAVNETRNNSS